MRTVTHLILTVVLGLAIWQGALLYEETNKVNEQKYDFAEINKINYGLFNINIWKEKIFSIIEKKAEDFDFKAGDLGGIKKEIENYLYGLHKEYIESGKLVEMFMDGQNQDNKLVGLFMNLFKGNIEDQVKNIDFKARIPGIADQMMIELNKKLPEIKKGITEQVSNMLVSESTSSIVDRRDVIYNKYGTIDLTTTNESLINNISISNSRISDLVKYVLAALFLLLLGIFLAKRFIGFKAAMVWMTLSCIAFLSLGLALPMIDLDARLSDVDLNLIGEEIHFDEQVMYFQSKSIIDVTKTLLEGRGWDLKLVGFLILLFSIILPFAKMLLSLFYLFIEKAKKSKLIQIIIFYMGKWSMADVFVVAIFMSYIGFYGLLNSQLAAMAQGNETVTIETVNYSKLSPGIIFFTLYCLLSIVMSSLIHRNSKSRDEAVPILKENNNTH